MGVKYMHQEHVFRVQKNTKQNQKNKKREISASLEY